MLCYSNANPTSLYSGLRDTDRLQSLKLLLKAVRTLTRARGTQSSMRRAVRMKRKRRKKWMMR